MKAVADTGDEDGVRHQPTLEHTIMIVPKRRLKLANEARKCNMAIEYSADFGFRSEDTVIFLIQIVREAVRRIVCRPAFAIYLHSTKHLTQSC